MIIIVRGWTQPWRLGVTAGQLSARLPLALPSALAHECGRARGISPPRESSPGPHLRLLETLQRPARWVTQRFLLQLYFFQEEREGKDPVLPAGVGEEEDR